MSRVSICFRFAFFPLYFLWFCMGSLDISLWLSGSPLVSFPDHFRHMGKIGRVNSLFRSRSLRQNVGGPIRLLCKSDVIHGNNGDQESWAIEAVCRRLGYAGLLPDHEKDVRSFGNGRDVLRACQLWMDSLNASKIAPESLCCWKRGFFPGSSLLGDRNLRSLQRNVSGRRYRVPQ